MPETMVATSIASVGTNMYATRRRSSR